MSPKLRSALQYTVITLIGAGFLYFVFAGTNWGELMEKFRQTDYRWIAAGMGISVLSHIIRGYRAVQLYDALGYRVPAKNSIYAVLIGYMMNYVIPRAGEVSRCAALAKTDDLPVSKSLGTVVTERVFDMVILLLILATVFMMQFDLLNGYIQKALNADKQAEQGISLKWILAGVVVLLFVVWILLRKRLAQSPLYAKLMGLLKGFAEGLLSIRQVKNPLLFVALSLGIWVCYVLMMYFCFFAMQATSGLNFAACLTVFAMGAIGIIVPAPGAGAGSYHFAIIQSLLLFGVPEQDGKAYAIIVHGVQMILLLIIGGICSLLVLGMHKKRSVQA